MLTFGILFWQILFPSDYARLSGSVQAEASMETSIDDFEWCVCVSARACEDMIGV